MSEQLALLPERLAAHLELALAALALAIALSLPVGVWVTHRPRAEPFALAVASAVQTIPSLALLAVMVPALAALGALARRFVGIDVPSIGYLPALLGLTCYGVLPILRNTVTGIRGVDPVVVEAARGVGMTDRERLRLVELPLAGPVVVAGIRTATVWIVGIATLATPIGAPSLGDYIFSGLQTRNLAAVLTGCFASAALALALDALVHAAEVGVRTGRRGIVAAALACLAALALATAAHAVGRRLGAAERPVVIGAKTFTEQYVLSEIVAGAIARTTSHPTRVVASLGSTVAFDALAAGALDLYVDYTGTIWATVMKRTDVPPDPAVVLAEVSRHLTETHGITLVAALGFENAYALAMRDESAGRLGVTTISDLAAHAPDLVMAGDYEFFGRPEWTALAATYGLRFRERRSMDASLMYAAVASAQVDVISAFSTDGRIGALGLTVLADDRHVIPPYDAVLLASARLVRERPDVVRALRPLAGAIPPDLMRRMNAAVDQDGETPAAVARAFVARFAAATLSPGP
ncbi:MAG: ABC transporter permease/substrate-binding protein [Deltaproteobacteria bacterium]|nr:ABC transporter permease/substrate-binding protein [Deltaproteobacteria bacterium]